MPAWKHRNRTIPVVSELEQSTCNHPASLLNRDFAPSSPCMAAQHWRTTRQIGMPCGLHGSPDPPRWSPTRAMRRMLEACAASSGCFGSRFPPASVRRQCLLLSHQQQAAYAAPTACSMSSTSSGANVLANLARDPRAPSPVVSACTPNPAHSTQHISHQVFEEVTAQEGAIVFAGM